ncbi:MAG: hypothetical protein PVG14_16465, partial [Anaerolineales bacterium]
GYHRKMFVVLARSDDAATGGRRQVRPRGRKKQADLAVGRLDQQRCDALELLPSGRTHWR